MSDDPAKALYRAVTSKDPAMLVEVERLIPLVGGPDAVIYNHHTVLAWASNSGTLETVAKVIALGADVNGVTGREKDTEPVLNFCVRHGWRKNGLAFVRALLDAGASVAASDVKGMTALHVAAFAGPMPDYALAVTEMLLEAGAPINVQDARGRTPLHIAVVTTAYRVVDLLVTRGASRTLRDGNGKNACEIAATEPEFPVHLIAKLQPVIA